MAVTLVQLPEVLDELLKEQVLTDRPNIELRKLVLLAGSVQRERDSSMKACESCEGGVDGRWV